MVYLGYLSLMTALIVLGNWLLKRLKFAWREHMSRHFEEQWLTKHRQYRLQLTGEPDNPDQRIAEDLWLLSDLTLSLVKSFCQTMARLISFVGFLWTASGVQTVLFAGSQWQVTGYLVWTAVLFSLFSTLLMHWVGHPLRRLNVERQHKEADYRTALVLIRENATEIALLRGEKTEKEKLRTLFSRIQKNWLALIGREVKVETFTAMQMRLSWFIPISATLPLYLKKSMTLGDMMQAQTAFTNVVDGFDWFLNSYRNLILLAAVIDRLSSFQTAMKSLPDIPPNRHWDQSQVSFHEVSYTTPQGACLAQNVNASFIAPQWVRIAGESGAGKTTLIKCAAGLWPWHSGYIDLPEDTFFLPQKPYIPKGSLRRVLSYPGSVIDDDQRLACVLEKIGLARLASSLDSERPWDKTLSGGEMQRIAACRVLLRRPRVVFLDEPTGQLDAQAAANVLTVLREELPHSLFLLVSHQEPPDSYCTDSLILRAGKTLAGADKNVVRNELTPGSMSCPHRMDSGTRHKDEPAL